jgi:hypothetical protein
VRRWIFAAAVLALPLVGAAPASALTHCVHPSGAGGCYTTIQGAVTAAGDNDTIEIAAGLYTESIVTDKANLHFVGAGAGTLDVAPDPTTQTIVVGTTMGDIGTVAFQLERGGSFTDMRVMGGPGDGTGGGGTALFLRDNATPGERNYVIEDVVALGGLPGASSILAGAGLSTSNPSGATVNVTWTRGGLRNSFTSSGSGGAVVFSSANQGFLSLSEVTIDTASDDRGNGISGLGDAPVTLTDSTVTAGNAGLGGASFTVTRSRVQGQDTGLSVGADQANVVRDSLLSSSGQTINVTGANSSVTVTGSTIFAGPVLTAVLTQNAAASVALRNTAVVRDPSSPPTQVDVRSTAGTITAVNSFFNSSEGPGSVPAPGSGSNLTGDPGMTDLAGGDFTLLPTSQLIDRGDPALIIDGERDLAGLPRSVDGNADCVVAPDVGAFEGAATNAVCEPPAPPPNGGGENVAPALSAVSLTNRSFAPVGVKAAAAKRGTTFRYTLSEPATVTITIERQLKGRRVKGKCRKPTAKNRTRRSCKRFKRVGSLEADEAGGAQSTFFSGRLRGRPLKVGRYRARLVAADAQGARSGERRLAFRIVKP